MPTLPPIVHPELVLDSAAVTAEAAGMKMQTTETEKASKKDRIKTPLPTSLLARISNKIAEGFSNFFGSMKQKFSLKKAEVGQVDEKLAAAKTAVTKPSAKERFKEFTTSAKTNMKNFGNSCKQKFKQITYQDVLKAAVVILTGILPGSIYFAVKAGYAKYKAHKIRNLAAPVIPSSAAAAISGLSNGDEANSQKHSPVAAPVVANTARTVFDSTHDATHDAVSGMTSSQEEKYDPDFLRYNHDIN